MRLLSVIQKEEDSLVKFKAMIYLLSDFFTAEILKGTMDIKGMQRSLEEATKQLLVSVDEDVSQIRNRIIPTEKGRKKWGLDEENENVGEEE